jgi:hypothetical protein
MTTRPYDLDEPMSRTATILLTVRHYDRGAVVGVSRYVVGRASPAVLRVSA